MMMPGERGPRAASVLLPPRRRVLAVSGVSLRRAGPFQLLVIAPFERRGAPRDAANWPQGLSGVFSGARGFRR